jgi:predicted DNA-binding WGR domain protein
LTYAGRGTELRYEEHGSSKFYRVYEMWDEDSADRRVLFQWGKIGSNGQSKVEVVSYIDEGAEVAEKKLNEKYRKGYQIAWSREFETVPPAVLQLAAVNERSTLQEEQRVELDPFARASADIDKAIRLATGDAAAHAEAVVISKSLHVTLDNLHAQLTSMQGQVEMVDALILHKLGA